MSVRLSAVAVLVLAACTGDGAIVGPFSGETRRFVIDGFELPATTTEARTAGTNLDAETEVDNALGLVVSTLRQYGGDEQTHVRDLFASGALASTIEIQADDFADDPSVGVTFSGRDGTASRVIGGAFAGSVFVPNRVAELGAEHAGQAVLAVPAFADTDPIELDAVALELHLAPDATGYQVTLAGAVRSADAIARAREAIVAQIANHPEDHRSMWTLVDLDLDGTITPDEIDRSLVASLLSPDLELAIDGTTEKVLSFGFRLHARPCESGRCQEVPASTCFDRARNGDETDVDCGGSCGLQCAGGHTCASDSDCQSRACTAGTCAAVSCGDGVKNGLEASLDCGGACTTKCQTGAVCGYGFDCATGACSATTSTGVCR